MSSTPEIFISYRYDDSAAMASRIHSYLTVALRNSARPNPVFIDNYNVAPGAELRRDIWRYLNKADVLLVIIGKDWLTLTGAGNDNPRLFDPDDFVREEIDYGIKEAIAGDMRVIPVLVNSARMPKPTELPHDIVNLADYKGISLGEDSFEEDMQQLTNQIKIYLKEADKEDLQEGVEAIRQQRSQNMYDFNTEVTKVPRPKHLDEQLSTEAQTARIEKVEIVQPSETPDKAKKQPVIPDEKPFIPSWLVIATIAIAIVLTLIINLLLPQL